VASVSVWIWANVGVSYSGKVFEHFTDIYQWDFLSVKHGHCHKNGNDLDAKSRWARELREYRLSLVTMLQLIPSARCILLRKKKTCHF